MTAVDPFVKEFVQNNIGHMSARDCAEALCSKGYNVTRNAVIGLAHRNNFPMKNSGGAGAGKAPRAPVKPRNNFIRPRRVNAQFAPSVASKPIEKSLVKAFVVTTSPPNPVTLLQLKKGQCRWPLGEFAARPPYLFCGGAVFVGCYCMEHYQRSVMGNGTTKETNHASRTTVGADQQ